MTFDKDKILNTIGFSLIGVAFLFATFRMVSSALRRTAPDSERIILAHWQLEAGLREAFEELIKDYTKLHPNVTVEQLPVPERLYTNWLVTKLVGEEAPDIIALGFGINNDRLARFFTPLTEYVDQPNPYNVGTEIEGQAWKNTYLDGLSSSFNNELMEYYGVGLSMFTIRLFYNLDLFEEIRGSDAEFPSNYREFLKLCEEVIEYAKAQNRVLVPLAGSKYSSFQTLNRLSNVINQNNIEELDLTGAMSPSIRFMMEGYMNGVYGPHNPSVQAFFNACREIGQFMTPGFMALAREDSNFAFTQQRAFAILSGSWDIPSLKKLSERFFRVGVAHLPIPAPDDPVYGQFIKGPVSEANTPTGMNFGISRQSKNFDRALDFLHFITSQRSAEKFAQKSSWLPAIAGARLPEEIKIFEPRMDGFVQGLAIFEIGQDTRTAFDQLFFQLMEPVNGLETFSDRLAERMKITVPQDIRRSNLANTRINQSLDISLITYIWLSTQLSTQNKIDRKLAGLGSRLITSEFELFFFQHTESLRSKQ